MAKKQHGPAGTAFGVVLCEFGGTINKGTWCLWAREVQDLIPYHPAYSGMQ